MFHRNFRGILNLYSFVPNGTVEFFPIEIISPKISFQTGPEVLGAERHGSKWTNTILQTGTATTGNTYQQQCSKNGAERTAKHWRNKSMDKHKNCLHDLAPHSAQRKSAGISRVHKLYRPAYVVSVAIAKQEFTPIVVVPCHNMAKKRALVWLSLTDCLL
jgi:hypothetical protein